MSFRQLITGVILAGGRGSRMGGQDKGLVLLSGKPLYQHILARLQPQVGEVLINANRNQPRYSESQLTVISDLNNHFSGPLAGMQAALHHAKTDWLLFVPCDVPAFPLNLAEKMFNEKEKHLACYALMNPLMILVKIIKLRWIHILSYDQMVSRKINNQTTRCANSIF
ncbi:molybdenum cofactor guanylyltransferase MobA, partial [Providencia rettgeri]|uniref:molybdenum cofactor guanylyltransferase MobA n=1 Tax=Providencia rettgeri TaxID=587 RepID=UPI001FF7703B